MAVKGEFKGEFQKDPYQNQVGGDHYKRYTIQPWHVIREYKLDYWLATALKHIMRCGKKDEEVQELRKAIHYLEMAIVVRKEPDFPFELVELTTKTSINTGVGFVDVFSENDKAQLQAFADKRELLAREKKEPSES